MTTALRLQVFGIALILVGGLNSVVEATQGYAVEGGVILVMGGLLAVLLGLAGPLFWQKSRDTEVNGWIDG